MENYLTYSTCDCHEMNKLVVMLPAMQSRIRISIYLHDFIYIYTSWIVRRCSYAWRVLLRLIQVISSSDDSTILATSIQHLWFAITGSHSIHHGPSWTWCNHFLKNVYYSDDWWQILEIIYYTEHVPYWQQIHKRTHISRGKSRWASRSKLLAEQIESPGWISATILMLAQCYSGTPC